MLKIAIIAGEVSGDILAANLIRSLQEIYQKPIELIGVGGEKMASIGLRSVFAMEILSVGGYGFDIIKAVPKILCMRQQIIRQIIKFKPDVFIGVDAPDFNLYVEKKLKQCGIKTVHYVSPTIWAWRYRRIFKIKKSTDLMLCVFPMEVALYKREKIQARFVGHNLADQIEMDVDTEYYRNKLDLNANATVNSNIFTILVGSRKDEIMRLGKVFILACNIIAKHCPDSLFLFPLVDQNACNLLTAILAETRIEFKYKILIDRTSDAIKASNMVLAKSGTVTLEVALCKKPLIISYKVAKLTEWILRRKLTIKYVGQVNILLDEEVARELLQEAANPENLAKNFIELYDDKARQAYMISRFYTLHNMLRKNAGFSAAKAVLELINNGS